jgi:hypothetical protein
MRRILVYLNVLAVILLMTTTCGGKNTSSQEEIAFATLIPIPMNEGVHLKLVEVRDGIEGGPPTITFILENRSNERLWFPSPGYGAQIFVYSKPTGEWQKVKDLSIYMSESENILVPKGEGINWRDWVGVTPDLSDTSGAVTVRVVVIGKVYRDGSPTDEKMGTYIDVKLKP